jgi:hypothetical protein
MRDLVVHAWTSLDGFYVIPFAAGGGVPLFTPDAHPGRLRLGGSTGWASGILELDYLQWPAG